ncbi:MAG: GldG family protein, partial [Planctomycetes bacterium]|nr:GldG family protein [Planctomycetota bacterium]
DKAQRVGVKQLDIRSQSSTSISVNRHWQGVRLVYGGGKQQVIAQWQPRSSFHAEAELTPVIKQAMTAQKRKFGYMEWPVQASGQQPGGIGWNLVRASEHATKRYEFQNFKDEEAALLPADLDTLFLFRPKELTDRQKYVLDQFVLRGGTLVAFVDAAEYMVGPQRVMQKLPMAIDAAGSQQSFVKQLEHYGIDWKPQLVADMAQAAHTPSNKLQEPYEYFSVLQQGGFGQAYAFAAYPYFFHPVAADWSQAADEFAKVDGKVDADLAARYRKEFGPGMPSDDFLFRAYKQIARGPGFYWPTWVGLREKAAGALDLPPGVTGRVLLWSSPAALAEDAPQNLNPFQTGVSQENLNKFLAKLGDRLKAEPRRQIPLMVEVRGPFSSYFAGMDRPKRPSEIREDEARKAEAAQKGEQPDDPARKPNPDEGPQPAKPDAQGSGDVAKEADKLDRATQPGRIVLVGDSDFLRDDFLRGDYARAGGPFSQRFASPFFLQMLDWLANDSDLIDLQSKVGIDRTLKFVDGTLIAGADPRLQEQELRSKTAWLRGINIVLPGTLLALIGFLVFLSRRAQKRAFLASLN